MAVDYLNLYPNGATVVSGSTPVYIEIDYLASLPNLAEFNSNSYINAEWSYPRHELVSWNTSSDGTGTSYPVGCNTLGLINSGTNLYAIWEIKHAINITYNNNSIYSSDSIPNSALIKTGGKFVTNDIQVTVQIEEYDGSVTVCDAPVIIEFTIAELSLHCQALSGMTWGYWCDSEYNIDGFYVDTSTNRIAKSPSSMYRVSYSGLGDYVVSTDTIESNHSYCWDMSPTAGGGPVTK